MNDIARTETCGTQKPLQKFPKKLASNGEDFCVVYFCIF